MVTQAGLKTYGTMRGKVLLTSAGFCQCFQSQFLLVLKGEMFSWTLETMFSGDCLKTLVQIVLSLRIDVILGKGCVCRI